MKDHIKARPRKHAFVVGYNHDRQCIYGLQDRGGVNFMNPMTRHTAEQELRRFPMVGKTVVLYELVPVKVHTITREDHARWKTPKKRKAREAGATQ